LGKLQQQKGKKGFSTNLSTDGLVDLSIMTERKEKGFSLHVKANIKHETSPRENRNNSSTSKIKVVLESKD